MPAFASPSRTFDQIAAEPHVIAFGVTSSGEGVRVHAVRMTRGTPSRSRRTWVVGYGIGEEGIAYGGGNCHPTLESALEAFDRKMVDGSGMVLKRPA